MFAGFGVFLCFCMHCPYAFSASRRLFYWPSVIFHLSIPAKRQHARVRARVGRSQLKSFVFLLYFSLFWVFGVIFDGSWIIFGCILPFCCILPHGGFLFDENSLFLVKIFLYEL